MCSCPCALRGWKNLTFIYMDVSNKTEINKYSLYYSCMVVSARMCCIIEQWITYSSASIIRCCCCFFHLPSHSERAMSSNDINYKIKINRWRQVQAIFIFFIEINSRWYTCFTRYESYWQIEWLSKCSTASKQYTSISFTICASRKKPVLH